MSFFAYPEDEGTTDSTDEADWDYNAAANLASLVHESHVSDYVLDGFDPDYDDSAEELTLSAGVARITDPDGAYDDASDEDRPWGVTYIVGTTSDETVDANSNDDVWLSFDPDGGDNAELVTSEPSGLSLKIVEIDDGSPSVVNELPDGEFAGLSAADAPDDDTDVARKQELDEKADTSDLDDHESADSDTHGLAADEYLAKTSRDDQQVDYGELVNVPSEFTPEEHGDDAHSEDYATDGELTDHEDDASAHHDRPGAGDHLDEDGDGDFNVDPSSIDASDLDGSSGDADQVLTTDGTDASWQDAGGGGGGGEPEALARSAFSTPGLPIGGLPDEYDSVEQSNLDDAASAVRSDEDLMREFASSDVALWKISQSEYALDEIVDGDTTARDTLYKSIEFLGYVLMNPDHFYDLDDATVDEWWDVASTRWGGSEEPSPTSGDYGSRSRMSSSVAANDPSQEDAYWDGEFAIPEWADDFEVYVEDADSEWDITVEVDVDGDTPDESADGEWYTYDVSEYRGEILTVEAEWDSNVTVYTSASAEFGDMNFK